MELDPLFDPVFIEPLLLEPLRPLEPLEDCEPEDPEGDDMPPLEPLEPDEPEGMDMPPLEPEPPELELDDEPDEPEEPEEPEEPPDDPEDELGMPLLDEEDCCSMHPPTRNAETAPTNVVCIARVSSRFNDECLGIAAPLSADFSPIRSAAAARRTVRSWS